MTVLEKLKKKLELNCFKPNEDQTYWEKCCDRKEMQITINKGSFEVMDIRHPVFKEGWWKEKYRLTHKNIDDLYLI